MRVALLLFVAALGLVFLYLGWLRVNAGDARFAYVTGAAGALLVLTGVAALVLRPSAVEGVSLIFLVVTILLSAACFLWAYVLWRRHENGTQSSDMHRVNLAIALGGGAAIALLLAWVQVFIGVVGDKQRELDEQAQQEVGDRQRILTLREDFRFRISLQSDLTGFTPPKDPQNNGKLLDLSGLGLAGKVLRSANLQEAELHGANMAESDLTGAQLSGARMDRLEGERRTNLRAATLRGAVAHGADFREANITTADLSGMYVHETNFEGALLDYADLRNLKCGEDTNRWHVCTDAELQAMHLPSAAGRPPTACWPGDRPVGPRQYCGADARNVRGD